MLAVLCVGTSGPLATADASGASSDTDWSVSIGAGVRTSPDYTGSDNRETSGIAIFDVRYEDWFFANPKGIGVNVVHGDRLRAGIVLGYGGGRANEGDLAPIDEVENGALGKAFFRYRHGPLEARFRVVQALSGDNEGNRLRLGSGSRMPIGPRWRWAISANADWHSDDWNDAIFSVSSTDAASLGVMPFTADGGVSRVGLGTRLSYRLSDTWSIATSLEASRLLGDAANSPIVSSLGDRDQSSAAVLLTYQS